MKITEINPIKLKFFPKNPPRDGLAGIPSRDVFLVQIKTDEGVEGIGEGFALGCLDSLETITNETLKPHLIGKNPLMIQQLWDAMYQNTSRYGRRGVTMAAISAVDIALWDILGKVSGQPVYKLLGAARETLEPYASAGYYMDGKGLTELQEEFTGYLDMGFKTMKMKVGGAPFNEDVERVRAVRKAVGDADFGIDANNAWDYPTALKMARICEEENVLFFEEPMSTDFMQDCIRLAHSTDVPIAGYETNLTRFGMRDFIVNDAVDIVQVDAIWSGGISEAKRVGELAAAWGKSVIPHFSASMVSLAANLSFGLSLSNTRYMEYTLDENPLRTELCQQGIVMKDGMVTVFEEPGLGLSLNWDTIGKYRV